MLKISKSEVWSPEAKRSPWIVMLLGEGLVRFNFVSLRNHIIVTGFGGPTASQVNVTELFFLTFTSLGCLVKVGKPALRQSDTLKLCS